MLLFGIVDNGVGRGLDGHIKAVKVLQKFVAAEVLGGKGVDDLFNFVGDDVSFNKIRIFENVPENPFGEKMLNKHLLDRLYRQFRVDRLAAQVVKIIKRGNETFVAGAFGFDLL